MLEDCSEAFPSSSNVFHPKDCVNSENSGNHIDSSATDFKNSLSTKEILNLPTSCPTIYMGVEKKVDGDNVLLSLSNIGEYSVEMLAQLTSSAVTVLKNHRSGSVKNGAGKKRKSQKFKPSSVWNHFSRLSDGNVHCTHCGKILKRKDSSTKTMWGHLRAIHFKGEDWTVLQQTLRDRNRLEVNETEVQCLDELDSSGIITAQNWLEQRVGILCEKSRETQLAAEMSKQLNDSSTTSVLRVRILFK